jgi:hypothetical protein
MGAKAATLGLVGIAAWACRQRGRLPNDPDEDAEDLFRQGAEEELTRMFGSAAASPWAKMGIGAAIVGGTMYIGAERDPEFAEPNEDAPPPGPVDPGGGRPPLTLIQGGRDAA